MLALAAAALLLRTCKVSLRGWLKEAAAVQHLAARHEYGRE
jgi:hypothetical protein